MKRLAILFLGLFLIGCAKPAPLPGDRIVLQPIRNGILYWFWPSPPYVVAADGSGEINISLPQFPSSLYADPVWSPDGQWIVYGTARGIPRGLELMRSDGTRRL